MEANGSEVKMPAVAELMRTNQVPTPEELRSGSVDMEQRLKNYRIFGKELRL